MVMTLSKALRYKKRVVENIRRLETDVQTSNSIVEGETQDTDVRLALKQRAAWVDHLVQLKLALQKATEPIQRLVFELAEAKSEIAFYQKLSVVHGTVKARFRDEQPVKYEATIRKPERDKLVKELQDRIDQYQTTIDAHNATVKLVVRDIELP